MRKVLFERDPWIIAADYEGSLMYFSPMRFYIKKGNKSIYELDDTPIYIVRDLKNVLEQLYDLSDKKRELNDKEEGVLGKLFNEYSFILEHQDECKRKFDRDPTDSYSLLSGMFAYRKSGRFILEICDWYPSMYSEEATEKDLQEWLENDYSLYVIELDRQEVARLLNNINRLSEEMERNCMSQ